MESLVSLQYPNGRLHQTTLSLPQALKPGDEFQLHGRCWQAVKPKPFGRAARELRLVCVSTSVADDRAG